MKSKHYRSQSLTNSQYLHDNQQYHRKLKSITFYYKNSENLPSNVFKDPSLIKQIQNKTNFIGNQQIYQQRQENITFFDFRYKSFTINCKNKPFPISIRINSNNVQCSVFISNIHDKPNKNNYTQKYLVKGKKLITLDNQKEKQFYYIGIQVKEENMGLLSVVSFTFFFRCQLRKSNVSQKIIRNFRSKSYKQEQRKKLEQYIQNNLSQAKDILKQKKRKHKVDYIQHNKNLSESHLKTTCTTFYKKQDTYDILNQTKQKLNYLNFENQKSKYINHLSKMNASIPERLQNSRIKYTNQKIGQVRNAAIFVKIFSFFKYLTVRQHQYHQQFMKQIRIQNICKRFIRKLKNKTKKKIILNNRLKLQFRQTLLTSCKLINISAEKKSCNLILSLFDTIKYKKIHKDIHQKSFLFSVKIKTIQKYWKNFIKHRKKVFVLMIEIISKSHKNDQIQKRLTQKIKNKIFTKYNQYLRKQYLQSLKKLKQQKQNNKFPLYHFFINKTKLNEIFMKILKINNNI